MSRIGKLPIQLPDKVEISVSDENLVTVKGQLGELQQQLTGNIKVGVEGTTVTLERQNEEKETKAKHGLYRALIANMVEGVSKGFEIKQELVGVGYKAETKGQMLQMSLGYSHDVAFVIPEEVKVEAKTERRQNPVITLKSCNKQLVGQVAAKIRKLRPPEPFKGKGIKFVGEELRRKAGKAAAKA